MPKILLSYRRSDSAAITGRIRDRLDTRYGSDSIFMDIDSIPFGRDFREHIHEALMGGDILLVIIGPRWLGTNDAGATRIQDQDDPVRVELEAAFERKMAVIPILVEKATMPRASALPESLQRLSYLNAAEVDSGRDFTQHIERVFRFIDNTLGSRQADAADPSPARVPDPTPVAAKRPPTVAGQDIRQVLQTPAPPPAPSPPPGDDRHPSRSALGDAPSVPRASVPPRPVGSAEVAAERMHLGFWIGLAALVVATVAIFLPGVSSILLSFVACAVAVAAGLAGDRFFAGATAIVAAVNCFLLNSLLTLFGTSGWLVLALAGVFVLAPFAGMLLRYTGRVELGVPAGTAALPPFVRNPQDFFGGLALLLLAIITWRASADLPGQQGFAFGPGTAPRLFISLLVLNALGIMAHGLAVAGPALEKYAIRGPLFVTTAVFVFAATIRPLGLVISSFAMIVIASLATPEMRWKETLIWGAVLSAFCAFLFPYVLNLPMQLWPRFW